MEVIQSFDSDPKLLAAALEQMASLRTIPGEKVEVVTSDVEGAREFRRPNTHECAVDFFEVELRLDGRSFRQGKAIEGRLHRAGVNVGKMSIDPECIEEVVGIAILVADLGDLFEAGDTLDCLVLVGGKGNHHGEWGPDVSCDPRNGAITPHLVNRAVKYHHFAVKVVKRSKSKVAVIE